MRTLFVWLFLAAAALHAEPRDFCPSIPRQKTSQPLPPQQPLAAPSPDLHLAGRVVLTAVISDRGNVCSAEVIEGFSKDIDHQAMQAVKTWRFQPARKGSQAVPVAVQVEVAVWRRTDGTLLIDAKQQKQAESPALPHN